MENELVTAKRLAGFTAIAGAVTMVIGAALWGTSGTDLWLALENGDISGYLLTSGIVKVQLVANLTVWIIGVLILGIAGTTMAGLSKQHFAYSQTAVFCYRTAVPMVIVSYVIMLSIVVQIAPETSINAVTMTDVIGWIGTRLDDISTALMIGVGPLFISLAGRDNWVPSWLMGWSYLTAIFGVFSIVVLYIQGFGQFGFIVIPVGVSWMIAAGILLIKQK